MVWSGSFDSQRPETADHSADVHADDAGSSFGCGASAGGYAERLPVEVVWLFGDNWKFDGAELTG